MGSSDGNSTGEIGRKTIQGKDPGDWVSTKDPGDWVSVKDGIPSKGEVAPVSVPGEHTPAAATLQGKDFGGGVIDHYGNAQKILSDINVLVKTKKNPDWLTGEGIIGSGVGERAIQDKLKELKYTAFSGLDQTQRKDLQNVIAASDWRDKEKRAAIDVLNPRTTPLKSDLSHEALTAISPGLSMTIQGLEGFGKSMDETPLVALSLAANPTKEELNFVGNKILNTFGYQVDSQTKEEMVKEMTGEEMPLGSAIAQTMGRGGAFVTNMALTTAIAPELGIAKVKDLSQVVGRVNKFWTLLQGLGARAIESGYQFGAERVLLHGGKETGEGIKTGLGFGSTTSIGNELAMKVFGEKFISRLASRVGGEVNARKMMAVLTGSTTATAAMAGMDAAHGKWWNVNDLTTNALFNLAATAAHVAPSNREGWISPKFKPLIDNGTFKDEAEAKDHAKEVSDVIGEFTDVVNDTKTELQSKEKQNATEEGKVAEGDKLQHQGIGEGGTLTEAGGSDSNVESGKVVEPKKEIKYKSAEQRTTMESILAKYADKPKERKTADKSKFKTLDEVKAEHNDPVFDQLVEAYKDNPHLVVRDRLGFRITEDAVQGGLKDLENGKKTVRGQAVLETIDRAYANNEVEIPGLRDIFGPTSNAQKNVSKEYITTEDLLNYHGKQILGHELDALDELQQKYESGALSETESDNIISHIEAQRAGETGTSRQGRYAELEPIIKAIESRQPSSENAKQTREEIGKILNEHFRTEDAIDLGNTLKAAGDDFTIQELADYHAELQKDFDREASKGVTSFETQVASFKKAIVREVVETATGRVFDNEKPLGPQVKEFFDQGGTGETPPPGEPPPESGDGTGDGEGPTNKIFEEPVKNWWEKIKDRFQKFRDFYGSDPIPNITRAGNDIKEKVLEAASTKIYLPYYVRNLESKVFGNDYGNSDLMNKYADILNKNNILGQYDTDLRIATELRAEAVKAEKDGDRKLASQFRKKASTYYDHAQEIAKKQNLEAMDKDLQDALKDKTILQYGKNWNESVVTEMNRFYNEIKGVDPGQERESRARYPELGERMNLMPKFLEDRFKNIEDPGAPLPEGSISNYRNPNVRADKFMRKAILTGDYSTDMHSILLNSFTGRLRETSKLRLYKAIVNGGLGVLHAGEAPKGWVPMPIKLPQTIDNKTQSVERVIFMPRDLAKEIRQILDTNQSIEKSPVADLVTQFQLLSAVDLAAHMKNIHTVILNSLGRNYGMKDLASKVPFLGTSMVVKDLTQLGIEIASKSPKVMDELAQMARLGEVRPKYPSVGIQSVTHGQEMIHMADTAARLWMNRAYTQLVERGWAKDNAVDRRNFIQQIGEYNRLLQKPFERYLKERGWSPFIVAGKTFNTFSKKMLVGSPGFKTQSVKADLSARAMQISGLAMATTFPALVNTFTTGSIWGRSGTPIGAIDLGPNLDTKDEKTGEIKHRIVDIFQLFGIRRGLRNYGLNEVIKGLQSKTDANIVAGQAFHEAVQSRLHPFIGPALGLGYQTVTGSRLDLRANMYQIYKDEKTYREQLIADGMDKKEAETEAKSAFSGIRGKIQNFETGVQQQNPFLYGILTAYRSENAAAGLKNVAQGLYKTPIGALGYNELKQKAEDYDTSELPDKMKKELKKNEPSMKISRPKKPSKPK
jgi:hypothetical protein